MSTDAIAFEGVRKTYGRKVAVDRVDFRVARGSFVGLLGHNGAGKSTCLKMLTGLVAPTEGVVRIDGIDVFADPVEARRRFGAVPEEPAVYEWLSAREFFEFVAEVRGAAEGAVQLALDTARLGSDAERPVREYSQGMRRRTALAAALLARPPVLVLDEALNGLDPPSAERIERLLRDHVDQGGAVLLSTHLVETIERVADRIVVLAAGKVVADRAVAELGADELRGLVGQPG